MHAEGEKSKWGAPEAAKQVYYQDQFGDRYLPRHLQGQTRASVNCAFCNLQRLCCCQRIVYLDTMIASQILRAG